MSVVCKLVCPINTAVALGGARCKQLVCAIVNPIHAELESGKVALFTRIGNSLYQRIITDGMSLSHIPSKIADSVSDCNTVGNIRVCSNIDNLTTGSITVIINASAINRRVNFISCRSRRLLDYISAQRFLANIVTVINTCKIIIITCNRN